MIFSWFLFLWGLLIYLWYNGYIRKLRKYVKYLAAISKIPGPKGDAVLGNLGQIWCKPETLFERLREWSKESGPLYILSLTPLFPAVNISGPQEFEKVAGSIKNIQKGLVYKFLNLWLGEGLLTSTGTKWHTRRKIVTPAFHFAILQEFVDIFNNETKKLVDSLKNESGNAATNVIPYISRFTLNTILETSMGTTLNFESQEDKNYVSAIHQMGKIVLHRLMRPWTYSNKIYYNFFQTGNKEKEAVRVLHNFTDKIISNRTKYLQRDEVDVSENKKKMAFLDLLINAKINNGVIDDDGVKEEVNTVLFEGHDTISTSIGFTLMLLANHKNYQDQIYEEILTTIGDSNDNPDIKQLNDLKFMERCIKESLRLYPSVPMISRFIEEDLVVNGYLLPRNTPVYIHIYDIHRNESDWPDPEKYDPDRFLPEACTKRHPFAFVPFSAGPRNCIGQRFAILELKAVLFGIIRNFILEPIDTPESIHLVPDLVLRTANESVLVKFKLR